jgi:hypothetical protein
MKIIVARYNEDVEWTKQFQNVTIYNKGVPLGNGYHEILLDNVGREGHTYYKYISDNYDKLDDYTIFLQGNPFDHSPHITGILTNIIHNHILYIMNVEFDFFSETILRTTMKEQSTRLDCANIYNTYEKIFGIKCSNEECVFGTGAQFIVSKKQILKRPKKFYENIVKVLEYSANPIEGYDIERFHKYIFYGYGDMKYIFGKIYDW